MTTEKQILSATACPFLQEQNTKAHSSVKSSIDPSYKPGKSMMLCLRLLSGITTGKLNLTLPNGQVIEIDSGNEGPSAEIHIHDDKAAQRFLTGGHLGFCESYLDAHWSSPDISQLFTLGLLNVDAFKEKFIGKTWYRGLSYLTHKLKPNTRKGSRKNIQSHYDISNTFYETWLDRSMTYSSGIYKSQNDTLEQAQANKYQRMLDRLGVTKNQHVLEIGCGWGGFAEYAARTTGARVTAITISRAQYDYATKRIQDAGLEDKVNIELKDYRDIEGKYDSIASIEMFEAVGEQYWPEYFSTIRDKLKTGGKAIIQTITIRNEDFPIYRRSPDYIQRYIFPGGMLPSKAVFKDHIDQAGLNLDNTFSFGQDYAKTLAKWNDAFQDAWPKLKQKGYDRRFKRLWEQYLSYCEAGFTVGSIDVIQAEITH